MLFLAIWPGEREMSVQNAQTLHCWTRVLNTALVVWPIVQLEIGRRGQAGVHALLPVDTAAFKQEVGPVCHRVEVKLHKNVQQPGKWKENTYLAHQLDATTHLATIRTTLVRLANFVLFFFFYDNFRMLATFSMNFQNLYDVAQIFGDILQIISYQKMWKNWSKFVPVGTIPSINQTPFLFYPTNMWTDSWIRRKKHSAAPPTGNRKTRVRSEFDPRQGCAVFFSSDPAVSSHLSDRKGKEFVKKLVSWDSTKIFHWGRRLLSKRLETNLRHS